MDAIGTVTLTVDGKGVWAKKPKPMPKPVSLAPQQVDDVFEVDPNSIQNILFSELLPSQEDVKSNRATICAGTQSPSNKPTSQTRRASLFGGAMRVKAPLDASKKSTLQTPGRVLAKARAPSSTSKQTPSSRTGAKSRLPDTVSAEYNECPDFLMATALKGVTVPQTPSKSLSQPSAYKTPGKYLPTTRDQCTTRDTTNISSENMEQPQEKSLEKNQIAAAPKTPGVKTSSSTSTGNQPTHFVFEHVAMPKPILTKPEKPKSIFDEAPLAPVGSLATAQSAPLLDFEPAKPTPTLKPVTSLPLGRVSYIKVEAPKPFDPASLPFPPTPKANILSPRVPAKPVVAATAGSEPNAALQPESAVRIDSSVAVVAASTAAALPLEAVTPTLEILPAPSTPVSTEVEAEVLGAKLRAIAAERVALLERLQRLEAEQALIISEYFSKQALGAK